MDNTVGSRQFDIIVGTLLGDGFLERNGNYDRLVIGHSFTQREYIEWKRKELSDLEPHINTLNRYDNRTNRFYGTYLLRTKTEPQFEIFRKLFYSKRVKKIPQNFSQLISPLVLAVWIMDDGYRRNDCNALRLNTQSYILTEQKILQKALAKLAIDSTIHHQKKYYLVYIPSRSMEKLRSIVRPYIIPSMGYKIV